MLTATGAGIAAGVAGCTGGGGQQTTAPPTTTMGGGTETGTETQTAGAKHIEAGDTGNVVHLLTDYSNEGWQKLWKEELIPAFTNELNLKTNIEYTGFQGTGEQRLTTLIQAGNPPESYTGSPFQSGDMLGKGQLAWTTHIVDYTTEQLGDLVGAPLEFQIDGQPEQYRVPHGQYTDTIHYRTDILEQLGLEIPKTNEELLHNAKVIDESDEVEARGMTVAAPKSGQSDSYFQSFFQARGVWLFRWKDEEKKEEVEVWFPKEDALAVLNWAKELAQYSPDPSSVNWGSTLGYWAGGRVAQMYHLNGWGAGVAANAGAGEIASNTDITPLLPYEGVEPSLGLGNPGFDGHPALNIADNVPGLFTLLKYMYGDADRAAQYYLTEPTRFIPAYTDIMDTDTYRNAKIFQDFPNLLDLNVKARDEIATLEPTSRELAYTPAAGYALRFPIIAEMMNQVIVVGRDPGKAYDEAKSRFQKRLAEGKELTSGNL